MKIYCTSRSNELDKFVGQDIWVKVRLTGRYAFTYHPLYIRVLRHTNSGNAYKINAIGADTVETGLISFGNTDIKLLLTTTCTIWNNTAQIINPIQVLTTDELIEYLQRDRE